MMSRVLLEKKKKAKTTIRRPKPFNSQSRKNSLKDHKPII